MGLPAVQRLRGTPSPSFVSLDSPVPSDDPGLTLSETIPDQQTTAPDREAERRSDRQFLLSLLKILSPVEQKVIRLRYGLEDGVPRTLQEVGRALGYVRQGVHRLETAALQRLKKHARFVLRAQLKAGVAGLATGT
jgi:RNA polymerase primary sigma factor